MKASPTESNSFPVADALLDVMQSENNVEAANDALDDVICRFRSGEISRADYDEATEMLTYKRYAADGAVAAARERVNNGGTPLTRTQKLTRFVFGHK
jgi:hypothetical protein